MATSRRRGNPQSLAYATLLLLATGAGMAACADGPASQPDLGAPAADSGVPPDQSRIDSMVQGDGGPACSCIPPQICDPVAGRCLTPATPERIKLFGSVNRLYIEATLDGVGPLYFNYDTGAPFSAIDPKKAAALKIGAGVKAAKLGQLAIGPRRFELFESSETSYPHPELPGGVLHGFVGNDFFAGWAVGIDFKQLELWLTPTQPTVVPLPHPPQVSPQSGVETPVDQPLGYLVVRCAFAEVTPTESCQLDTGAGPSVALEDHWNTVAHPSPRIVPTSIPDYSGKLMPGFFQRASVVRAGPAETKGPAVAVFPKFEVLRGVADAIKRPLVGIVGLSMMREHFTSIDYDNHRVIFYRYLDQSHLPTDEFSGFGFVLGLDPGGQSYQVEAVIPGTNAAAAGLLAGDLLLSASNPDLPWVLGSYLAGPPNTTVTFELQRGSLVYQADIETEDLLPPIP